MTVLSLRTQARQAIAVGDQAAARALLQQLFVENAPDSLSTVLTDAVVAVASTDSDTEARERYQQTQRDLDGLIAWLDSAEVDAGDLARTRSHLDRRVARLEAESNQRQAQEGALADGGGRRRPVGAGWLEVKRIPRPNGQLSAPYLYYRARSAGRLKSVYIGKLAD